MSLETYFAQIRNIKVLTRRELLPLIKSAQEGNIPARDKIVLHNLKLVVHIAKGYRNNGIPFDDLIGWGNVGLFKAIKKYDLKVTTTSFATYASRLIKRCIFKYIEEAKQIIRVPRYLTRTKRQLRRNPKAKVRKSFKRILFTTDIKYSSLDTADTTGHELVNFLGILFPTRERIDFVLIVGMIKKSRSKNILLDRMQGNTLQAIGKKYHLSRERVRQIIIDSVTTIRKKLKSEI